MMTIYVIPFSILTKFLSPTQVNLCNFAKKAKIHSSHSLAVYARFNVKLPQFVEHLIHYFFSMCTYPKPEVIDGWLSVRNA